MASKPIAERLRLAGSSACDSKRRPFTRPALDKDQRRLQLSVSTRAAKPTPKIKEKRLINGKWTRDYGQSVSDKMRAVAARLRGGKPLKQFLGQFKRGTDEQAILYTATETAEERGKVWRRMEEVPFPAGGRCPNCGNSEFYEGPSGGLATNVECSRCHLRWNANNVGLNWQFIGFNDARREVEEFLES